MHKDTIIFLCLMSLAYSLILFVEMLGLFGLWGSLVVLVFASLYFSMTFFRSEDGFEKLYYYACVLGFIIGYFALVYQSFGIIDTSTNEVIKKDWFEAFYFSVVTWTTLGFGDYKPTPEMKPWVMVEALLGYIFMALLVGKFMHFMMPKDIIKTK